MTEGNAKSLIIAFASLIFSLSCFTEESSLSSDSAVFSEKSLRLDGNVEFENQQFLMKASSAVLNNYNQNEEPIFTKATLSNNVIFRFGDTTNLRCQLGEFDLQNLSGNLQGKDSFIYFEDKIGQRSTPIIIESTNAKFALIDKRSSDSLQLKSLLLEGSVTSHYDSNLRLCSDKALLTTQDSEDCSYTLSASKLPENGTCYIVSTSDVIEADEITFNEGQNIITAKESKGILNSKFIQTSLDSNCKFFSKFLFFNRNTQTVKLENNVLIEDPQFGNLACDGSLTILQTKEQKQNLIDAILCQGITKLCFSTSQDEQSIKATKSLEFNKQELQLSAISDSTTWQSFYENHQWKIYADEILIDFTLVNFLLKPFIVTFKGNVKLISKSNDPPSCLALADTLVHKTLTKETTLSCSPEHKVLFCDKENDLKISAHEIQITYDESTSQDNIRGLGNVRFTFNNNESELFENHLSPFYLTLDPDYDS